MCSDLGRKHGQRYDLNLNQKDTGIYVEFLVSVMLSASHITLFMLLLL
jgi:hypothetical protein